MPADARERLAGLMLDALDFGGKDAPKKPKKKTVILSDEDRARMNGAKAQGMTEAGTRVAADLKQLVEAILRERRAGGVATTDASGNPTGLKPRSVDEILADWRKKASEKQDGKKASIAEYAKFMRQGKRSDYESRVLSLYKALEGPEEKSDVSRETVKRERAKQGDMAKRERAKKGDMDEVDALIKMYNRAIAILREIDKNAADVTEKLYSGGQGQNRRGELEAAQERLENKVAQMFLGGDDQASTGVETTARKK